MSIIIILYVQYVREYERQTKVAFLLQFKDKIVLHKMSTKRSIKENFIIENIKSKSAILRKYRLKI